MKKKIIPIASDHAGFALKEHIMSHLNRDIYEFRDFGAFSDKSVDYPDTIHPLAEAVNRGEFGMGIIICGSGNGATMVANKYENIRAALCWNSEIARLARSHNDANILALPGRFIDFSEAMNAVNMFLITKFERGRHERRVKKIARKKK